MEQALDVCTKVDWVFAIGVLFAGMLAGVILASLVMWAADRPAGRRRR